MFFSSALVAGLLLAVAEGNADALAPRQDSCPPVHIIVARASLEAPGEGIIGAVANDTATDNPGTTVEAIEYPATLANYTTSSGNGTLAMTAALDKIVANCGDSGTKVVLMGYSQGAHVVGDTICGGGGIGNEFTPPATDAVSKHVVAMIQMGDPRFIANQTFDVGTSKENGLLARPQNISCEPYASKIKSYCDEGDPYCAKGGNLTAHLVYVGKYGTEAREFVNEKIKAANSSSTSTAAGPSGTGYGTGNSTGTGRPSGTGFYGVGGTGTVFPSGTGAGTGGQQTSMSHNWSPPSATPMALGAVIAPVAGLLALL